MFGPNDRFTPADRRTLHALARSLFLIGQKLDLNLEISIADLALERKNMTTLADVETQVAAILVKAEKQDDLTLAIGDTLTALKAQYAQVKADLDALIAAGNPSEAALTALSANLAAIDAAIDADDAAKAIIKGTEADPNA